MSKVGIFGYYRFNNFGDNLMALMIARHLVSAGHKATILGIDDETASSVGAAAVSSADELARCSDIFLLGGGAALSDFNARTCSLNQLTFDQDCFQLARLARQQNIPCLALSIGGNSKGLSRGVRSGVMTYLTSPMLKGATTRLASDVEFLRHLLDSAGYLDNEIESHPDLVFCLNEIYPEIEVKTPRHETRRNKIAVNLGADRNDVPAIRYLRLLDLVGIIDLALLHNSVREEERFHQWFPFTRNNHHVSCHHPVDLVKEIKEFDLVISHRLHLGVAALSVGVPFLAFNAWDKTKMALAELRWEQHCMSTRYRKLPSLLMDLALKRNRSTALSLPVDIEQVTRASANHFKWLSQQLTRLST